MAWIYHQRTGDLFHDDAFVGTGYSGAGTSFAEGRNNTSMETVKKKGPIPRGKWLIGNIKQGTHMGPLAITLSPLDGTNTFKRSGFFVHGNNNANNASEGCVILAKGIRTDLIHSYDKSFSVI